MGRPTGSPGRGQRQDLPFGLDTNSHPEAHVTPIQLLRVANLGSAALNRPIWAAAATEIFSAHPSPELDMGQVCWPDYSSQGVDRTQSSISKQQVPPQSTCDLTVDIRRETTKGRKGEARIARNECKPNSLHHSLAWLHLEVRTKGLNQSLLERDDV